MSSSSVFYFPSILLQDRIGLASVNKHFILRVGVLFTRFLTHYFTLVNSDQL